ncbi:transposase-like zinc-binding domain-containing protein [Nitratifractor salsuginis]
MVPKKDFFYRWLVKKCPICGSKATKKNGKRAGIQRYFLPKLPAELLFS